jgi:hypothetical protein
VEEDVHEHRLRQRSDMRSVICFDALRCKNSQGGILCE